MQILQPINLAPDRFVFWTPPAGAVIHVGPERLPLELPVYPLPLPGGTPAGNPSDNLIGQGVYDYLRQFPDCLGNTLYAALLRDGFPHFLTDLAAQAVMLDAKDVEPAYVLRKLTCLKILRLIEPGNPGLLAQLCRGYFALACELSELANCRCHLREAMRFGQELLAIAPDDPLALSHLAEIDLLFGDTPAAAAKWRRLAAMTEDAVLHQAIEARLNGLACDTCPETAPIDDLEIMAEAMQLHAQGDAEGASRLLESVEESGRMSGSFAAADFYWLLGVCRRDCGDLGGAARALCRAVELDPQHAGAVDALDKL